jgi:hypothetical protein
VEHETSDNPDGCRHRPVWLCAFFQPAAEEAARGIVKYCEEPFAARSVYRNTIQAELPDGYSVHVQCPGDPEAD